MDKKKRILIIEKDDYYQDVLFKVVKEAGYEADITESGEDAIEMMESNKYILALLAINLIGIDGFGVIEEIRRSRNNMPIIIVSERIDDFDALYGLDIGADDYIIKPFNPVTLGAKIKALIRRSHCTPPPGSVVNIGPFRYDSSTLRFYKDGKEIPLTGKENSMMKLFLDNPERIFSREMLYDLIWGDAIIDDNAIMVYINRLRQKIEDKPEKPRYIQTIRGIGYRFVV